MNQDIFIQLLSDLYNLYNPSKVKNVSDIISNYAGNEYDAIKTILLKYNFKGHPSYNEDANSDKYVHYIISKYIDGDRILSKQNIITQTEQEELKKISEQQKEQKIKEEELEKHKSEIQKTSTNFIEKLKQEVESIEKRMSDFEEKYNKIQKLYEDLSVLENKTIESKRNNKIKINIESLNFTDSDIELPNQEVIESLAKGSRIILKTSSGSVCGVEVKDITYDLVSYENEVLKEIILEKI